METLALLYICGSTSYGDITPEQLRTGLQRLGAEDESGWKNNAYGFTSHVSSRARTLTRIGRGEDREEFGRFHSFLFRYHLFKPGQKTLGRVAAEAVLRVELCPRYRLCERFLEFMQATHVEVLNMDQWNMMVEVFETIGKGGKLNPQDACMQLKRFSCRARRVRPVLCLAQGQLF